MSFNNLYNEVSSGDERSRLMATVRRSLSNDPAEAILGVSRGAINYFTNLPPGDMRFHPEHPKFRHRTSDDLRVVNDGSANPVERVAHLASVVYQVRCNLIHGSKDPANQRDRELVEHSRIVLDALLTSLIEPSTRTE
jgi:hypothetical protein